MISTLSRGAVRSGRYASSSIVTPIAEHSAIVASSTTGTATTAGTPLSIARNPNMLASVHPSQAVAHVPVGRV